MPQNRVSVSIGVILPIEAIGGLTVAFKRREVIDDRGHTRGVIDCPCGREVLCYGFTNTCECGRDFNMGGQELAPREQWGEETGESLADIMNEREDY